MISVTASVKEKKRFFFVEETFKIVQMDLPPGIPDQDENTNSTTEKDVQIDTKDEVDEKSEEGVVDETPSKDSDAEGSKDVQNESSTVVVAQDDEEIPKVEEVPKIADENLDAQNDDATLAKEEEISKSEDFSNVDISNMNVTKEEIDEIYDIFTLYDRNGDGVITESDLSTVIESMQKYKPTKDQVRRAIRSMIPHHEGEEVDFASFVWYKLHDRQLREKSANSKDIIEAFRHFDKDNDGFWSIGDLRYMFNQIDVMRTEDQLAETLKEVDVDGDGKISFEDFRKTMTSFIPNSLKALNLKGLSWRRHSALH